MDDARAERGLQAACLASAAAGAIHLGTAPSHLMEYVPSGLFMLTAGLAQAVWVLLALKQPRARLYGLAVAGNLALVALWAMSRTTGLPFGQMPWQPEDVHSNDVLAVIMELVVVFACLGLLDRSLPNPAGRLRAIALAGAALAVTVSSHDATREHITTAAALLLIAVAARVPQEAPELLAVRRPAWRSHVDPALARRRIAVLDAVVRTTFGAR